MRFENKIAANDDVKSPALPHAQGRLNIEVAVNDPLPGYIGCVLSVSYTHLTLPTIYPV